MSRVMGRIIPGQLYVPEWHSYAGVILLQSTNLCWNAIKEYFHLLGAAVENLPCVIFLSPLTTHDAVSH